MGGMLFGIFSKKKMSSSKKPQPNGKETDKKSFSEPDIPKPALNDKAATYLRESGKIEDYPDEPAKGESNR